MDKKQRRSQTLATHRGMTLLEVVVVVSILAILAGWIRPLAKVVLVSQKHEKVRKELNILARALETYWLDNHMGTSDADFGFFPPALSDSGFLGIHYPGDPDIYTDEFLYFENDPSDLETSYRYEVTGAPKVAYLWSVGPDGTDEQRLGGGDDIIISVSSERIGRWITRKKLRDIGRAAIDYIVGSKLVSSSDAWAIATSDTTIPSTYFGMDAWYNRDGWGRSWDVCDTKYRFFSKGPNGSKDTTNYCTDALQSDDIGW